LKSWDTKNNITFLLYIPLIIMEESWKEKFIKWFEEEIADSDKPLDEHWDVKVDEINNSIWIKATSPRTPYSVFVNISRGFASLQIYTGIETAIMEIKERLKIYRTLLMLNGRWKMAKYVIGGDNDEIIILTDLDLAALNREEFNDALTVTLLALNDMVEKLGLDEEYREAQLMHVLKIVDEKLQKGETKEQVAEYLVKAFGISRETAREIVREATKNKDEPEFPIYR